MKWYATCLVLGLALSSSAFVKRDVGSSLFQSGKEYVYDYQATVMAGSEDYVTYASAYNITGVLHVQATGTTFNVKLDSIKFGAFNGQFSYNPPSPHSMKEYEQLSPLQEPFQVKFDHGKVNGIVLNSNIPEWAHNIKRGLASALQLELSKIKIDHAESFFTQEETVVGDCKTHYVVIPGEDAQHAQIRKFRKHSDCTDAPQRIRRPGIDALYCPDNNSRDLLNSTGFAIYDLEVKNGNVVVKKIKQGSTVIFNVLGVDGHTQSSMSMAVFTLKDVVDSGFQKISAPSNPKSYDHIHFVFENELTEDEDLKTPKPYFFHHKVAQLDSDFQAKAADQLHQQIKKLHDSLHNIAAYKDLKEFHRTSPFAIVPLVSSMDYEHLKQEDQKFKAGDENENKIFLDALVMSGTGPAALVIRDIVKNTQEPTIVARLMGPLPNYIRNPTEKLAKEMEELLDVEQPKHNHRIIEFSFASLLHRACKKTNCQKTGLLNKYVQKWFQEYQNADHFETKTVAIAKLRNIGLKSAAEKLMTIVEKKTEDRSVRVAAMGGLKSLLKDNPSCFKEHLMPLFYDRQNHPEIRNMALTWTLITSADEYVWNEVAIYMWTEKDPQVKNFAKTIMEGFAGSVRPCNLKSGSWAKSALQMFPPWEVNGKYSGNYMSEYYDRQYNFGHVTHMNVQKNGKSILPSTIYLGLNGQLAGFGTNYLSAYGRFEGLGKSLSSRIMSMTTGEDYENIQNIFSKVGIQEREPEPLKIELALFLHGRIVAYHAADAKTVTTIPQLIKKLGELKSASYDKELTRMLMIGGAMMEMPLEFGTPVSVISAVTGIANIQAKVGSDKSGSTVSRNYDVKLQFNLHGLSTLNNHLPAFGSMHSVAASRSLRARVPRHVSIGVDVKQMTVNFAVDTPTEDDPMVAQVHATAFTGVQSDAPARHPDAKVIEILTASCPTCKWREIISKGEKYREDRQLGSGYKYKFMEGISTGIKYYDCEKIHSRIHVFRQLRKFFGPEDKNVQGRFGKALTQVRVGMSYLIKAVFLSPPTETCGMKMWFKQDPKADSVLEKVEGQIKGKYEGDYKEKLGSKVQAKASFNMKYGGKTPKTKTLDIQVTASKIGMEKREVKAKVAVRDESANFNGVLCVDVNAQGSKANDFFAYEGDNEPTYERTTNIVWGKEEKASKDMACPTNSAQIKIVRKSHRSQAQKDEATKDMWPYKQCKEVKGSPKYPGPLTPATEPCIWAAFKQTNLRESNVTITYKVDSGARNRWKYPGAILAGILMPYWVPSDAVDSHIDSHSEHEHGTTADGKFIQGHIDMGVSMDDEHPEADIHFYSSQGEQEHFHGVDLNFLPGGFKRPVYSRFDAFFAAAMQHGIYSYCDVTPGAVQTFDNLTYYADMSECPTIISADCSPKPRYAVIGHKTAADKIAITVMMGEHKVVMSDINTVTVDDKAVSLSDNDKIVTPDGDAKLFKILKHDENNIFLLSQPLSVFVRYTGHYTTVTAGSRYRDTQCGVCGNFDGCKENEFTGPEKTCKGMGPNDMMKAYIVRDGNCAGVGSPCPVSG